jgi:hypothetical protein
MTHRHRLSAVAGVAVLTLSMGALAGCGGDDKTGVARPADELSADAATSPAVGDDEQGTTIGTATPSAVEGLPEGFPADEVPLLREKVLTGSAGDPDGAAELARRQRRVGRGTQGVRSGWLHDRTRQRAG